jgi:hypothetical protein
MLAPNADVAPDAGIAIDDAGIAIDAAGNAELDEAASACAFRCCAKELVAARRFGRRPRDCLVLAPNDEDEDGVTTGALWWPLSRGATSTASAS